MFQAIEDPFLSNKTRGTIPKNTCLDKKLAVFKQ